MFQNLYNLFHNDCGIVVDIDNLSVLNFKTHTRKMISTIKNRKNDKYKRG
jgi:hypothetical protein